MDEAGLVDEVSMPLKEIHYHLDDPKVSTVMLSNRMLDAAKMNRAAIVLQMDPKTTDLQQLAAGCLFYEVDIPHEHKKTVTALCCAYQEVSRKGKAMLAQRDFVYFIRQLSRRCIKEEGGRVFRLTPEALLECLERNLNGVDHNQFKEIAHVFFKHMAAVRRDSNDASSWIEKAEVDPVQWNLPDNSLQRIRESISDCLQEVM